MLKPASIIPTEIILNRIFLLREEKVMLDFQLAEFYKIENRALKQAVRRNMDLFPSDFMFVLSDIEVEVMVSQNVIPSKQYLGGSNPFAFTESGVAMLSSILKSKKAREINIAIMRAFVSLRKIALTNTELRLEVEKIRKKIDNQDQNIEIIFRYFDELLEQKDRPRNKIGYQIPDKKN